MTKNIFGAPFACLVLTSCGAKEEPPTKPVVEVKTATAEQQDIRIFVGAPASVFPREQANVAVRITAPIMRLLVRKGDSVKAGQTLAVLESRDVIAQREEAAASVADAQTSMQKTVSSTLPSDIERARGQLQTAESLYNQAGQIYEKRQELFKLGAIPQRELMVSWTEMATSKTNYDVAKNALGLIENQSRDRDIKIAQSRLQQAQARLKGSEAQMAYTSIVSPFAGTITEQFMYPGDMAKPDMPMFTVMDLSVAVARAQAPEAEAGAVKMGESCVFQSADRPDAAHKGRISVVNRAVDVARRTVEVWCEIPSPPPDLRAGTFGEVRILTATVHGVVVPQAAVQFNEGTRTGWVMTVDEKRISHKREIEAGDISDGKVQVLKGLNAGETVVIEGAYGLTEGTQTKLHENAKAGAK
jgi:HlyD family secretion protein